MTKEQTIKLMQDLIEYNQKKSNAVYDSDKWESGLNAGYADAFKLAIEMIERMD